MNACVRLFCGILITLFAAASVRAEYAIKDGDTVVFLGDSITAARAYGKVIENYTLLRYPNRKVRFINAGKGGDTAAGGLKRLDRDVLDQGATLVTVAYGVNDIGWGMKADDEHRKAYLEGIRGIVERCKERKVRVYICSAAITAEDPNKSETGFLQSMCDEGMALARSLGEHSIDVERTMRAAQKRVWEANAKVTDESKKTTLHASDGIHLNDLGQQAMALAILKGLGAPAEVSSVEIDAEEPKPLEASGCHVTELARTSDGQLQFVRLDEGLPVNFGLFGALAYRFVSFPDEVNKYMLTVKNLHKGKYELLADDRPLGKFTSVQLEQGVNLCSATADPWEPGGPWEAQATILISLTNARNELAVSRALTGVYVPNRPDKAALDEQSEAINTRLETLQRSVVKPVPFHFVIRKAAEEKK